MNSNSPSSTPQAPAEVGAPRRITPQEPDTLKGWIGKRVLMRPGAPKEIVGSLGRVEATQWSPFGWRLAVILDKRPGVEILVTESSVREDGSSLPPSSPQAALGVREELSPIVQKTVECLARELRANVGDEIIQAQFIDTPATCTKCGQKCHAPTTGKMLNTCFCGGLLKTDSLSAPMPAGGELGDFQKLLLTVAHFDLAYHTLRSKARAVTQSGRSFSGAQSAVLTDALDSLQITLEVEPPKWDRESLDRAAPVAQGGETEAGHRAIAYAKAAQIDKEFARLSVLVDSLACHLNPNKEP